MADVLELNPSNVLEIALGAARRGEMSIKEFIALLLRFSVQLL